MKDENETAKKEADKQKLENAALLKQIKQLKDQHQAELSKVQSQLEAATKQTTLAKQQVTDLQARFDKLQTESKPKKEITPSKFATKTIEQKKPSKLTIDGDQKIGNAVKTLMRNSMPNNLFQSGGLLKENMTFVNEQKENLESDDDDEAFERAGRLEESKLPVEEG